VAGVAQFHLVAAKTGIVPRKPIRQAD